ncbi:uncharacterized protein BXZ73DRAFT_53015 [Epithele typhae]|uniref:uncharacterized protein n=1 Tax=Epithele typhae TaxID=378194 RepID=UPI0020082865|nr:uncharacterized protein BXZ73DRAFT_53015 [Epithele typhae]KAH9918400.1 hypothetical protein BXZ73DRAFT_53015 [Epithele typhae]
MATHPEAFVLLHIPDVTLTAGGTSTSGTLALECVTLAPDAPSHPPGSQSQPDTLAASLSPEDRSLILVLRLGALELPIDPARPCNLRIAVDGTRTYAFTAASPTTPGGTPEPSSPSGMTLAVPPPARADPHRAETVEAFDHILAQYADLDWQVDGGAPHAEHPAGSDAAAASASSADAHPPVSVMTGEPAPESLRGKLVLVDEASGEVVGELPNRVSIKEDPALAHPSQTKGADGQPAPVMLELPEDVYDAYTGQGASVVPYAAPSTELDEAREIFVRAIPPEDQDWMTKSATLISSAISTSTTLLLGGLTHATNYYINHSAPAPTPKDGQPPPPPPRALLLLSHPRTQSTLSKAYAVSGQAVKVSARTVKIAEDLITRAVGGKPKAKTQPVSTLAMPQARTPSSGTLTPTSAPMVQSPHSEYPPPPYPGVTDGKPALPPRRSPAPTSGPGPAPPLPPRGKSPQPGQQPPPPPPRVRTRDKVLLSANLVLAAVDDGLQRTFDVGAERAAAVAAHKYGAEVGKSVHLGAHTARNVALVYIDARGFARRALIRRAGKAWVKAHFGGGGRATSGLVVDRAEPEQGAQGRK